MGEGREGNTEGRNPAPNTGDDRLGLSSPQGHPPPPPLPFLLLPSDLQRIGKSPSSLSTTSSNTARSNPLKANLFGALKGFKASSPRGKHQHWAGLTLRVVLSSYSVAGIFLPFPTTQPSTLNDFQKLCHPACPMSALLEDK